MEDKIKDISMALTNDMLLRIKQEIENDPEGVGYYGKNNSEIAALLSNNYVKQRQVNDIYQAPVARILAFMSNTPNEVTPAEVAQAKNL